ncbi:hypothetical protein GCM10008018_31150 [Paenibacillus marchantiophytorum]|uniref:Integrase catalytic domain-containing protein n=1 Tax=Paenibacillus marchantiophytorum TaxID=1619310 RepID=A0ABQ1EQV2_9BACL|nr:hypothetical protein GCM10008018_31150 [Paenibacillus marchantiophytorum]
MRWVHEFGPEIDKRIRPFLKPTNDSWRTDETYIKVKGQWKYLYRAVDSMGKTIDFMLSENRDMPAAKRFFTKALTSSHTQIPRVITLDKNPAYPPAIQELINEKSLPKETLIRQTKVSKQHCGARSPVHKENHKTNAWFQIVSYSGSDVKEN